MTRYGLDPTTRLAADNDGLVIGGSPLRLFSLSAAGRARFAKVAAGEDVANTRLVERLVDAGAIHPVARHASDRLTDVTVVIPTRGGDPTRVAGLVDSCPGAARVLVIDDASPSPVAPTTGVEVVRHDVNRGPAAARNTGLQLARTELVAFVDDDIVSADPDWLARLAGHFDDERVAAVAPRVRSRLSGGLLAGYERVHSPLDLGGDGALVTPGGRVSYVPAAALVVRRSAVEAVGGFDPLLRYGEDVDLVWRLTERGFRCRYEPTVEVEHDPRRSWGAWLGQRFAYGSSAAPLATRHKGALAPVRTTVWSLAIWLLVFARRPGAAFALAAWTGGALARRVPSLGWQDAIRLTTLGHIHAGRSIAAAVRRVWWPMAALGSLRWRTPRWLLAVSAVTPLLDRSTSARHLAVRLADEASYSAGVWAGVIRHREIGPLLPKIVTWPGRRHPRV